jgi:hypothetical protein
VKVCLQILMAGILVVALAGCASPAKKTKEIRLGMTPDEVLDVMGKPTTIRAAKVYEDGQTQAVWEYVQAFAINPRDVWIFFENDKAVQWGAPGDFFGAVGLSQKVSVKEYSPVKQNR